MEVKEFVRKNYKHFNSAVLAEAAEAWCRHLKAGGKMLVAMAGAMSTAEIGISLDAMIRQDKVHAVSCTGANLEEDIFNLIAHDHYRVIPNYRNLSPQEEKNILDARLSRVTDTCIPEEEAMRRLEEHLYPIWEKAEEEGQRYFPYEYIYQLLRSGNLRPYYQIDPKYSWVFAACEKNLPIYTPGWEDSTLGNVVIAQKIMGRLKSYGFVKTGFEQMECLAAWYEKNSLNSSVGFFQIGGGIAGDFSICVVPMLRQDLKRDCRHWGYFCQISDSTTSYGSYSGAVPNEKITWDKLGIDTPRFIIESDASIVAPLMFQYVLSKLD